MLVFSLFTNTFSEFSRHRLRERIIKRFYLGLYNRNYELFQQITVNTMGGEIRTITESRKKPHIFQLPTRN